MSGADSKPMTSEDCKSNSVQDTYKRSMYHIKRACELGQQTLDGCAEAAKSREMFLHNIEVALLWFNNGMMYQMASLDASEPDQPSAETATEAPEEEPQPAGESPCGVQEESCSPAPSLNIVPKEESDAEGTGELCISPEGKGV